jgi:nitroreductase
MFKSDPIPKKVLEDIIETSQWAGSAMNTQPWEFAILGGDKMEGLREKLGNAEGPMELEFADGFPLPDNYSKRAKEYMETSGNYQFPPGTENVEEKRGAFMKIRSRFSKAPNVIIVYGDKHLTNWPWGFFSIGIIAQNVCLAALEYGLGTCILGMPAARPNIIREVCGISSEKVIICVIAIGYPDFEARINNFPRERMPLADWVQWHDF